MSWCHDVMMSLFSLMCSAKIENYLMITNRCRINFSRAPGRFRSSSGTATIYQDHSRSRVSNTLVKTSISMRVLFFWNLNLLGHAYRCSACPVYTHVTFIYQSTRSMMYLCGGSSIYAYFYMVQNSRILMRFLAQTFFCGFFTPQHKFNRLQLNNVRLRGYSRDQQCRPIKKAAKFLNGKRLDMKLLKDYTYTKLRSGNWLETSLSFYQVLSQKRNQVSATHRSTEKR